MPSTVIRRFDYAPERRELLIEFTTGRRYVYAAVPEEEVKAMRAAFAKGRYFNARIRDRYKAREIVSS
jgi:KTSC domain